MELFDALKSYPEVRRMDKHMQEYVKIKPLPSKLPLSSILAEYEKFEIVTNNKIKRANRNRWIAAAAVWSILALTAYFLFKLKNNDTAPIVTNSKGGIQLQLANGQSYNLNGDTVINVANNKITLNQSQLSVATQNSGDERMNEILVPAKLDYQLTLADGSTVQLNSKTQMKFPFSFGKTREVYVDGEAYFDVKADPSKPFIVRFPGGQLQVLGTSFNIKTYERQLSVASLVTGSAEVITAKQRVLLSPGIEATVSDGNLNTQAFDEENTLSWRQGVMYFDNASLKEITEAIERWYDVPIKCDDAAGNIKLTTRITKGQELSEFFTMLENAAKLKLKVNHDEIQIRK